MARSFLNSQVVSENLNQRVYHLCDTIRTYLWQDTLTVRKIYNMGIDEILLRTYEYALITRDLITKGKSR
jgi:hypothetical protein